MFQRPVYEKYSTLRGVSVPLLCIHLFALVFKRFKSLHSEGAEIAFIFVDGAAMPSAAPLARQMSA